MTPEASLLDIDMDSVPREVKIGDTVRLLNGQPVIVDRIEEIHQLRLRQAGKLWMVPTKWQSDDDEAHEQQHDQPPCFQRDPGLVRAELVDALRDYAGIFRDKAQMEIHRAEAVEEMARKIEAGGSAEQPDIELSGEFARAYHLLELRFNEVKLRCSRLMLEHGEN